MGIFSWLFGGKSKPSTHSDASQQSKIETYNTSKAQVRWRSGSFPMDVVGESNYQKALISICGPHTRHGHDQEYMAIIKLEPSNKYDSNAVVVQISSKVVGYLPRGEALRVGSQMREENLSKATCNARVKGGWRTNQHDEGHYGVQLAIPRQGWIDFGTGRTDPGTKTSWSKTDPAPKTERPQAAKSGPLLGEKIAFSGMRSDCDLAKNLAGKGAYIMANLGKSTSVLVVNEERPFSVAMMTSARYEIADKQIKDGRNLRIMSLSEAHALAN